MTAYLKLTAHLKHTVAKTVLMPIDKMGTEELKEVFRSLEASGREFLAGEEGHIRQIQVGRILDVRYIGQSKRWPS